MKMECFACLDEVTCTRNIDTLLQLGSLIDKMQGYNHDIYALIANDRLLALFQNADDDYSRYWRTLVKKIKFDYSELSEQDLEEKFEENSYVNQVCFCGKSVYLSIRFSQLYIDSIEKLDDVHTYYLCKSESFNSLYDDMKIYFDKLFFSGYHNWKPFQIKDIPEVVKAISFLNSKGKSIFQRVRDSNQAIREINTSFTCTGSRNVVKRQVEYNGRMLNIVCNPHIKIEKKNSNKRIYFAWNTSEIDKIIIFYIGSHQGMANLK